jgi:hypothetical protein
MDYLWFLDLIQESMRIFRVSCGLSQPWTVRVNQNPTWILLPPMKGQVVTLWRAGTFVVIMKAILNSANNDRDK